MTPVWVRQRGRGAVLPRRDYALRLVAVYANGVPDINQTSLVMSGLSIGRLAAGQVVTCVFTVSHVRPVTGIELFSAKDTFSGVVLDPRTGYVILTLDTAEVNLSVGRYTAVRLTSTGALPTSYAGKHVIVEVGPYTLFQAAVVGQPPYVGAGILDASAIVPASGASSTTPVVPPSSGGFGAVGSIVVGAGALAALGVGGYLVYEHRKRAIG